MKLNGKVLDAELAIRKQAKEERRNKRLTLREAAKQKGISVTDMIAYENGQDVCPHKKWEDQAVGFPLPKLIFKVCKKCGKINEATTEKVCDKNLKRVYNIYKRIYGDKKSSKVNKNSNKK